MSSRYSLFDRSRLRLRPLAERRHDLHLGHWLELNSPVPAFDHPDLGTLAARLAAAKASGAARILIMGAHVLRAGVNRHLIDLMERGLLSNSALNGAGSLPAYELARIGAPKERVAR